MFCADDLHNKQYVESWVSCLTLSFLKQIHPYHWANNNQTFPKENCFWAQIRQLLHIIAFFNFHLVSLFLFYFCNRCTNRLWFQHLLRNSLQHCTMHLDTWTLLAKVKNGRIGILIKRTNFVRNGLPYFITMVHHVFPLWVYPIKLL